MLLKYLDLQGFKSFPDKTRVTFGKGLTGVVGPNGSGKSNISDAVRWVLGEQSTKTLRGGKMEDVIFSGTQSRRPQGFAEVSLTIDNQDRRLEIDADEVTISRRFDRSGESEYRINRNPVRLKDLHELLMDTGLGRDGYSIVGQGKIAEIIQAKNSDRREIFEEAAGISKYRYRKEEAERSLARAEDNLVRLRDILGELESRISPLKEQSEKAGRFLELAEQKKTLEVSLWIQVIEKSNRALKDHSDRLLVLRRRHEQSEEQIAQIEEAIQRTYAEMQACSIKIDGIRRSKEELETANAEISAQIAVLKNDIAHHEQGIARLDSELAVHSRRAENVLQELSLREQEYTRLTALLEQAGQEEAAKQSALQQHLFESEMQNQQEQELREKIQTLALRQSRVKMEMLSAKSGCAELREVLLSNEKELQNQRQEQEEYRTQLDRISAFLQTLKSREEGLRNVWAGYQKKLEGRREVLEASRQESERITLRIKEQRQKERLLTGLEQSLDGYAYSVKEVLKRAKNGVLQGIRGTVSQLLETDAAYSVAIETALGGAMQHLIVDQESHAQAAIRLLKAEKLGRATFLPLSAMTSSPLQAKGLENYPGYLGLAVERARYDPALRPAVEFLLGRIVLAEDLDAAVQIAKSYGYKFRVVTLDGQMVNTGGSMTGGSRNKGQNFLSRKNEISDLKTEIDRLQKEEAAVSDRLRRQEEEVLAASGLLEEAQAELAALNEDRIRAEGEQKRLQEQFAQADSLKSRMEAELEEKYQKAENLRAQAEEQAAESDRLEKELNAAESEQAAFQNSSQISESRRQTLTEELTALKLRRVSLEKDAESLCAGMEELKSRRESAGDDLSRLLQEQEACRLQIQEIGEKIIGSEQRKTENQAASIGLEQKIQEQAALRQELEASTTRLRQEERRISAEQGNCTGEIARMEERRIQLEREYDEKIRQLWDEYELTRSEAQKRAVRLEDPVKANAELLSLRNQIRALGSVNLEAIEEYREVRERYDFLNSQIWDAEHSKSELIRLIQDLIARMQEIFGKNFREINRCFQETFRELFGGGHAELHLSDPEEMLDSGIDISVEPPGKVITNLAALSGGEQALVAIAIYFAIMRVHPAPFCVLDEIEAALDDVNIDKYAAYLQKMAEQTQFILITHRRGSMEAADMLYGVTMQEEGVSKLLQLKVAELERTALAVT